MNLRFLFLCIAFYFCANNIFAQKTNPSFTDSAFNIQKKTKIPQGEDTAFTNHYKPGIAIKRSAMLPGWGQYTNKKYWKIPIVYAGVGIPAYLFFLK